MSLKNFSDYNLRQAPSNVKSWTIFVALKVLTGKMHPQIKLKRLQKVWIGIFGQLIY